MRIQICNLCNSISQVLPGLGWYATSAQKLFRTCQKLSATDVHNGDDQPYSMSTILKKLP